MITQVRVRDAKDDKFSRGYLEVPDAADIDDVIRNALAQAFRTYGIKRR